MPADRLVRRLTPADAPAYRAVHLHALAAHPAAFAASVEEEEGLPLSEFAARMERWTVLGGFRHGALKAIATLQRHEAMKRRHVVMLWGMYVADEERGSGLAEALMQAAIEAASAMADQLELYVAVSNDRAARFYRRFGFTTYGIMPRSLRVDGVDHDAEMMVRVFR